MPAVNRAPPDGVALPAPKLNIPGLPILLLAAALKLNPPGAGAPTAGTVLAPNAGVPPPLVPNAKVLGPGAA